jgi:hypothetical protein
MADDKPKPSPDDNRKKLRRGGIKLPTIDSAMNRTMPKPGGGGRGTKDDKDNAALGFEDKEQAGDEKILERAKKRFDAAITSESDNRKEALEDRKMVSGDQWPADVQAARQQDQRPCITINKLKTFVRQVTNSQRENRPAIHISPIGDRGDPEAAKMFAGMIRFIERESDADVAYDTAFADTVKSGFGYFRLMSEYEKPSSFNQVLKIVRVRNPFTVYMDCAIQEPDGADQKWCFVTEMIPRSEFEDRWPDADPCNWDKAGIGETLKNWITQQDVRVAEYFEIQYDKKKLVGLSNGAVLFEEDIADDVWEQIDAGKIEIEAEREAEVPTVKWYRMTCKEILERRDWLGQWIPVFKVIGDEDDIEGKVKLAGMVRDARSPQQMFNYWNTSLTETIALAPKAPYIGAAGQFEGHEDKWLQANTKSFPYLEYNQVDLEGKPAPPPQRQPLSSVPAGIQQAIQNAAQDMMAVTGIRFDSTVSERFHDESGIAINALSDKGDLTNFHYIDNLGRTMKHLGRCLIDAIPKYYDTKQVVTILREDGTEQQVMLDPSGKNGQNIANPSNPAKKLPIFNPTVGEYGCAVTIGPAFATKRIEASQRMLEFAKIFPQFAEAFSDLIAKNQDWPGGEEFTVRLTKLVAQKYPGVLSPDMKDVPPAVQAMLMSMDQQLKKLTQEHIQALKALQDKSADRAVDVHKIDVDFEAKLLAIVQRMEQASLKSQTELQTTFMTHIGAEIKALGAGVNELKKSIDTPKDAKAS